MATTTRHRRHVRRVTARKTCPVCGLYQLVVRDYESREVTCEHCGWWGLPPRKKDRP